MTKKSTMSLICVTTVIFVIFVVVFYAFTVGGAGGSDGTGSAGSSGNADTGASSGAQTSDTDAPSSSGGTTSEPETDAPGTSVAPGTETETSTPPETVAPVKTEIKLGKSSITVTEGETAKVTFELTPSDADASKVSLRAADSAIASVELGSGEITVKGVSAGTTTVEVLYDGTVLASLSVTVKEPTGTRPLPPVQQSSEIDPSKPMIALTFDDGPGPHTDQLLDILKKYNVHATFFVQGVMFHSSRVPFMKRAIEEGNEIGIHTWNHKKLTDLSEADMREEIVSVREYLEKNIGYTPRLMRPPYGSYNDTVKEVCREEGLIIVRWCVDPEDWKTKDPDKTYEAIMSSAKDGVIILCHDIHDETIAAMDRTIAALIEKGYQLVTVSEMLQYSETVPQAGDVVKRK